MKQIVIVGGGTAGWITACYLAKTLSAQSPGTVAITLVESADIGILGVGEGTFPTIRKTLRRIGVDEAQLMRACEATPKQGAKFVHWREPPGHRAPNHYLHAFQSTAEPNGLDLLPYWLLGVAGDDSWDAVNTPQKKVADAFRAPKLISHPNYVAPLNYAYHFDAVKLAGLLRDTAIGLGVQHLTDTIDEVRMAEDGAIAAVVGRQHGPLSAHLYVDCSGFRARLIGQALGVPYRSCRDVLFCDRALAVQVPYSSPDAPIPSYTISTAHEAGWTWDIGLQTRRGVGYVYSSAHTDDARAETILAGYLGDAARRAEFRQLKFDAGFREINWQKNCVAIGLSSGFFEPLEATGIVFAEVAAVMLSTLFPWGGDHTASAKQFNEIMLKRYRRALDFIKLHYCISQREDHLFWRDNTAVASIPDSLQDLLDRWRHRPPDPIDVDTNVDIFTEGSWQYVLYGMGYKTDITAKRSVYKYFEEAKMAFADIARQVQYAQDILPTNRDLINALRERDFGDDGARRQYG